MNYLEIIAALMLGLTIYLQGRQSIWNWPAAIVANSALLFVSLSVGLYADVALRIIFVGLSVYGWIHWVRAAEDDPRHNLPISLMSKSLIFKCLAFLIISSILIYLLLSLTDSPAAIFSAVSVSSSLLAQYLLTQKKLQQWFFWIFGVNLPMMLMFLNVGLPVLAGLQLVFIALGVMGLRTWIKAYRKQHLLQVEIE